MTLLAPKPAEQSANLEIQRRLFTLTEFEQMSDLGLFADQHVELLNGEIFVKGMQSPHHVKALRRLTKMFAPLESQVLISPQFPMVLLSPPTDFVEPDIALLQLPEDLYNNRNATSTDALLVVEVSDNALARDRSTKLEAYARNNIPQYWIYNVTANELEVCTEPDGKVYTLRRVLKSGQSVELLGEKLEWWV
jgi:Uma2 family endonuclease